METPSAHSPNNQELHLSVGYLPKLEARPAHTVTTASAEVGLIPGIESPRNEAIAGLLGATLLIAAGGALYARNRQRSNLGVAPRDPYPAATGHAAKRDRAGGDFATSTYADPNAYVNSKFVGAHMKKRGPAVIGYLNNQGLPAQQLGTAPRTLMHYTDPNQRARENGKPLPISRSSWGLGEGRSVRSVRKLNKGRAIERERIIPNVARFGDMVLDRDEQEAYIAQHPELTRSDKRQIRKAGSQARSAGARVGSLEYRARGWRNR